MSRELATLAIVHVEQGGRLNVRQREQLRRALATAGESLGWTTFTAGAVGSVDQAAKDVTKLAKGGAKSLGQELADELAGKKKEMSELERVAKAMHKLAAADEFDDPVEVAYSHTARDGADGFVTKTETLTLTTAREARDAAESIERRMEAWNKLREQMLDDIKLRQKKLDEVASDLSGFADSSRGLLREVFATLY